MAGKMMFASKKEEIIYFAGKLMRKRGFNATTMMDIANEAGILKGSLYRHFSSKEEIFFQRISKDIQHLSENARAIIEGGGSPSEKLRTMISSHAAYLMNNNDSMALFSQVSNKSDLDSEQANNYIMKRDLYENMFRQVIREGIDQGYFPQELDPKLTTLCIMGMVNWVIQWYRSDGDLSSEEIAEYMAFFVSTLIDKKGKPSESA